MSNELWVIADAILFFLMLLPFLNAAKWGKESKYIRFTFSKSWVNFLWIGCLLFCLYNKTEGDYFHYQKYLEEINSSRFKEPTFEAPYMFLASIVGNNYFLFRLAIWGGTILIFRKLLKITKLENSLTIFIFILFTLIAFAYGRVALALSVFYLGFVYYYQAIQYRRYFEISIGVLLIGISFFLNKDKNLCSYCTVKQFYKSLKCGYAGICFRQKCLLWLFYNLPSCCSYLIFATYAHARLH